MNSIRLLRQYTNTEDDKLSHVVHMIAYIDIILYIQSFAQIPIIYINIIYLCLTKTNKSYYNTL